MIYGYVRKCAEESHRSTIGEFAAQNGVSIGQWTENIDLVAKGDIVIANDISQLGTGILPVLDKLAHLLKAGAQVWTVEEGYKLGGETGATLAFGFGLSAEVKRRILSERTRESLRYAKADGKKLGRPFGKGQRKLAGRAVEMHRLLSEGIPKVEVARRLGVCRSTLFAFIHNTASKAINPENP